MREACASIYNCAIWQLSGRKRLVDVPSGSFGEAAAGVAQQVWWRSICGVMWCGWCDSVLCDAANCMSHGGGQFWSLK